MRAVAPLACLAMLAASCAGGPGAQAGRPGFLAATGNPSEVIAAELAFAREATEKGQWTAFRKFGASDAVWAGPQWELVQTALKGASDPAQAIKWEPDRVWMSCDGSYALSTGPYRAPNGKEGRFTTIWQRQDDGSYRFVLDQGFPLDQGYRKPEMIAALVADCPAGRRPHPQKTRRGLAWQTGQSDDGTLTWSSALRPDCSRELVVSASRDGKMTEIFRRVSDPPAPPADAGRQAVCA